MSNATPTHLVHFDPSYVIDGGFDTISKNGRVAEALRRRPDLGIGIVSPVPVDPERLAKVHAPDYVRAVISGEPRDLAGSAGIGWSPAHVNSWLASTGGVVDAVKRVLAGDAVSGSLSSGLHHARYGRGSGYCTLNGLALAAFEAIESGAAAVLVIDVDAHGGGGTADIIERLHLEGVDGIHQVDVSVNPFDGYESTDRVSHVLSGADTYLDDIRRALESVKDPSRYDVVIYNAGMDPHEKAGGRFGIDTETITERERMVFDWCADNRLGVAWVLAGGYASGDFDLDDVAELHVSTAQAASRVNRSR